MRIDASNITSIVYYLCNEVRINCVVWYALIAWQHCARLGRVLTRSNQLCKNCIVTMQRLRSELGLVHSQPIPALSIYQAVRQCRGYTVTQAAQRIGITQRAWSRREVKEKYRASELVGLYRMSGLSPAKFLKLLEKCR